MRIITAFVVALFLAFSVAGNATEKIRVRVAQFAPNYFLQDGRWIGLDVELAEAVVEEAGFAAEFVELPWSRALACIESGKLDLMTNLSRTPDREALMDFVGPERISKRVLVVRRENLALRINGLDDLVSAAARTGLKFGIQTDAKYSVAFDRRLAHDPAFANSFETVSQGALLPKKVAAGRNLGFFEDENYVAYQLRTNPDFRELAVHPYVLSIEPVYFGLSKHLDDVTRHRLETAFARLERNGTLAGIRRHWGSGG